MLLAENVNQPMTVDQQSLRDAARVVNDAQALLITAGAGIGVDSGLPDFRGRDGFWRAYPVIAKLGLSFSEMANPQWFNQSPELAWAFYGHRLNLYRDTTPHAGFAQLLNWAAQKPGGYFVFTSNVDGQFQKAGFAQERIVECHGSIRHFQCCRPCVDEIWDAAREKVVVDESVFRATSPLPLCKHCSHLARPNILMFGDPDWLSHRTDAQHVNLSRWLDDLRFHSMKLAVIELGAGTALPTVRHMSERMASRFQCPLIRINPREPEVPEPQIGLPFGAAEGIAKIGGAMTH